MLLNILQKGQGQIHVVPGDKVTAAFNNHEVQRPLCSEVATYSFISLFVLIVIKLSRLSLKPTSQLEIQLIDYKVLSLGQA